MYATSYRSGRVFCASDAVHRHPPSNGVGSNTSQYQDLYKDWARAREVGEDGCVLVRPDMHVAWRANGMADDPSAQLLDVMKRSLALPI